MENKMLTLKEEIEQELVEWRKVIGDIESHCARYQPSKYLTLLKSRAEQNLEHLQKRLGNDSSPVEPEVSQENGGLDYDFIVRVMLSMTEYPDLLPENIRVEKTKLSKRYRELYDQREPHILARIEWLKEYIESRFSG